MSRYRGTSATIVSLILLSFSLCIAASEKPDALQCEAQLEANPNREEPARCFYELAIGTTPSRAAAGERLERLQTAHADNPWLSLYLARLKWRTHDPAEVAKAETLYGRAATLAARQHLAAAEYQAKAGLSRIFRDSGRLAKEGAAVEDAVRIAESSGDRVLRTKAAILNADHLTARGELQKAYFILHQLRDAVDQETSSLTKSDYLFALGSITQQTGRFHEMRDAYRELAEVTETNGDRASLAQAEYGLALARLLELKEVPADDGRREMLRLAERALSVARSAGSPVVEAEAHWMLGSFGDPSKAQGHLERCFAVAATPRKRSYCRMALARHLAASDPAAAMKAIDEALALARASGDVWSGTSVWSARMRVSWQIGPPERALADSEAALDAIEALRDQQGGSSSQPGLFSTWAEAYYWLSGRLLEAGKLERGFRTIERMRSRSLIDALGLAQPGPGVPPALLARRADLILDIAQVQRRLLDPGLGKKEHDDARARLGRLESEEEDLRARIARADPAFAALRPPSFASLEKVRGTLAADEALLSFQIAPWKDLAGDFGGGSWLLASTRNGTQVYPLPDRIELRPAVDVLTGLLAEGGASATVVSAHLYKKLLGAALAELPAGIHRLVIVPDDALHRLPFAALRPAEREPPLASQYQVTVVPSATLWLRFREAQPARPAPALVFADPVSPATTAGAAAKRGAAFASPIRFGKLPWARREGKSVIDHLDGDSKLLLDEAASETYLKQGGADRFGLLHFATHALTDDVNPDRSGVVLSPGNAKEDGLLQVREITDLELDGRVVVLSSCSSASGEILRGEGVMGLARAFFEAGAQTVVASLWPLRDDYGAALFDRFYLHLAKGKSVAAALQAAQRDRMEEGVPTEAWAGVVVLGNGDRVPVPGGRRSAAPILWSGGAALVVLLGAWLAYRRRLTAFRS